MEADFMDISNGSDTIAWLRKYKKYPKLEAEILAMYGLSIHRYKMSDEDCQLVVEILCHCSEVKLFRFSHSIGIQPLLKALKRIKTSLPKVCLHHLRHK